jgi:hypothetical protein
MFFRTFGKAGLAKKAFKLVTIALGGPETIKIALFALDLLYQLRLALPERI